MAIDFTNLDFDQIKSALIEYLKGQSDWTDYDYDGSNISMLLDLLAYNSQYAAFMANMVANEGFLSTATSRDNVVSLAKQLGYNPASVTGAGSTFTITFTLNPLDYPTGFPKSITIQPGGVFSVSYSAPTDKSTAYMISAKQSYTTGVGGDGVARFEDIYLSEGLYISESFTVSYEDAFRSYTLNNQNIDVGTISVSVQENPPSPVTTTYTNAEGLVGISELSKVYWIEEISNDRYKIIFGDSIFGYRPPIGAVITVSYLVSNGEDANGIRGVSNFAFIGNVVDSNTNKILTLPVVSGTPKLEGGSDREDIGSIKFRAPKSFAAQNRAVTSSDYEAILKKLYPAIQDVYVYGGETQSPPEYGKVFVVAKPIYGNYLSNTVKTRLTNELKRYKVAATYVRFVDPGILNIESSIVLYYNQSLTKLTVKVLESNIRTALTEYSNGSTLKKFNSAFKYSKVVSLIDASDASITRSEVKIVMRRDLPVVYNTASTYTVTYGNPLNIDTINPVVQSTGFNISSSVNTYYFADDNKGNIYLYYINSSGNRVVENSTFGTVDYELGIINLAYNSSVVITQTDVTNYIQIRAIPRYYDIVGKNEIYLNYDVANSTISINAES